jgi:hypothetical protein
VLREVGRDYGMRAGFQCRIGEMSQQPKPLWIGARKTLSRAEAVEQYIILRLRAEDINRLDFLMNALHDNRITLPSDPPFSAGNLTETIRTVVLGLLATLMDRDGKAVYAFNCLFTLFPNRKPQIIKAQTSLEAIYEKLQQFRNNVAFHSRSKFSTHIEARKNFRDEDTYLDLVSAIHDFQALIRILRAEEVDSIPELPTLLEQLQINHHPAFSTTDEELLH